jgi:hypothetical protein
LASQLRFNILATVRSCDLSFRVICVNSDDEVIARANNLIVGRDRFEAWKSRGPHKKTRVN